MFSYFFYFFYAGSYTQLCKMWSLRDCTPFLRYFHDVTGKEPHCTWDKLVWRSQGFLNFTVIRDIICYTDFIATWAERWFWRQIAGVIFCWTLISLLYIWISLLRKKKKKFLGSVNTSHTIDSGSIPIDYNTKSLDQSPEIICWIF